jgi:hypothetical protein
MRSNSFARSSFGLSGLGVHGSQQAGNGIEIKHDRWSAETLGLTL